MEQYNAYNICLRCILQISYMDHITNADVRVCLRAGSPPQLLPLIQTRRLRFFGHVARMGDSRDLSRALHTTCVNSHATQGLEAPPRTSASHLALDPGSRPSATQSWPELSMATRPGQRTLEAARGNGYAPVRRTPVMMMMRTQTRLSELCSEVLNPETLQRPISSSLTTYLY